MRFFDRCFIFIFVLMIILPLVFVDLSSNRVSVQENRTLATFPRLTDLKHHQGQFIRDFDAWFKDSTGFREQLLALSNVMGINTWMSGVKYNKGQLPYLIGEHGHQFFAGLNGELIQVFQGKPVFSDEQLANIANKLEEVKKYLDRQGIPLVVVFMTFKESIYPEYYPKSIKRGPEPIQLDVITDYLREHTNIDIFNIRQALLEEKDNYLLYLVSSGDIFHYTEIGGFFAYRELMKHINIYFSDIVPYDLNDIDISYDKKVESILEPDVTLKRGVTFKKLAPSFFDDVELNRPFTWENVAYENKNPDLPVILVFRDSFSGVFTQTYEKKYLTQFIASQFSKAIFIHLNNLKHFEEYVDRYKPDIVVFESTEYFDEFAKHVADIPELVNNMHGDSRQAK